MRIIETFEDHFWDFYNNQREEVQTKIDYVLHIVMSMERIPTKFFKHIDDGIYEIRIKVGSDICRIFCFFDTDRLVILLNAFQKKSQKIPKQEIAKARKLRDSYHEQK
jgi:phage-related protein